MESRAKIAGHPVHQMLIVFPLGLLVTAIAFDIAYLVSDNSRWAVMAYDLIAVGVIGGLVAAPFGLIDWLGIPSGTRAKRVGLMHGVGNVIVLALFVVSWVLRRGTVPMPPTEAIVAGLAGGALAVITGWLGGELVDRLGVGVDDGAHLDSPSSLSALPAATGLGGAARAVAAMGWSGVERRIHPTPAYVGVERRRTALR